MLWDSGRALALAEGPVLWGAAGPRRRRLRLSRLMLSMLTIMLVGKLEFLKQNGVAPQVGAHVVECPMQDPILLRLLEDTDPAQRPSFEVKGLVLLVQEPIQLEAHDP